MALQHEDFGEKIGGAKKDLWKERGLYVSDLDVMNDREAEKYVRKDNVWKKPDYDAMLKDGIPLGVAFFVKKVRDTLPATPQYSYADNSPEKRLARQKEYIETVRQLEGIISGLRTPEDVRQVYPKFCIEGGYMEPTHGYASNHFQMTQKGRAFACYIKDKLPYASDYLAGHADCALTMVTNKDGSLEIIKAFPEGEERKAINDVFDEIIQDLKREQLLTHSDITLPLPAAERQQISLFDDDRPSVLGQLATVKAQEKSAGVKPTTKKKEDMQL